MAAQLIAKYLKMMKWMRLYGDDPKKIIEKESLREEILLGLYYLKEKNKEIEATFPAYSNFDIVIDNLDLLDQSMTAIKGKYEVLEKNLEQLIRKIS